MQQKSILHTAAAVLLVGALIFLGITWWVNGQDDTWLYIVCAVIILTSFIPMLPKKNGDNVQ